MRCHSCEPALTRAQAVNLRGVVEGLMAAPRGAMAGPAILAIDGRSSNGKSTLAARIAAVVPGAEVVHTDDVASGHSRFGWDDLLGTGIIEPLRRGQSVAFRPPGWPTDRPGAINVAADAPLVVIEGVGAGRRTLAERVDAVIWVQSDLDVTETRNSERIAAGELSRDGYNDWMAEEIPFQERERTWDRADIVVDGSGLVEHDPQTEIVLLQ